MTIYFENVRILLAEDHPINAELQQRFDLEGMRVEFAGDGAEAVKCFE